MESPSELTLWFLRYLDRFDVRISNHEWLSTVLPGYTDVSVELKYGRHHLNGNGFAENEDLALTKALAEVFERLVLIEHGFETSSGIAAHTDVRRAEENASNELRERDLFLCHFLTHTPFGIANDEFRRDSNFVLMKDHFASIGLAMELHLLGASGFVVSIDGRNSSRLPFGLIFGASVSASPPEAILSATVEAARQGADLVRSDRSSIPTHSLLEFARLSSYDFSDHAKLALNIEYAGSIDWIIKADGAPRSNDFHSVRSVELQSSYLDELSCPLRFVRAQSAELQKLFVGPSKLEHLNKERLIRFAGREFHDTEINLLPHPFA